MSNQEYKMTISKAEIIRIHQEEYMNGISTTKLGKKYEVSSAYFSRWFKKLGLPVRNNSDKSRKYVFNENVFEKIDTEEKAYWLGFLYADGYIMSRRKNGNPKVGITLSVNDIGHLEKFRKFVSGDMPIKIYKPSKSSYEGSGDYCRILITSEKMASDLIRHGVLEHKTNVLKPPKLPPTLIKHFIRGYYDGDGSIWCQSNNRGKNTQYSVGFVGTKDMLEFIQQELMSRRILTREYPMSRRGPDSDVLQWKFGGNNIVIDYLMYLYSDASVYLERKLRKADGLKTLAYSRL